MKRLGLVVSLGLISMAQLAFGIAFDASQYQQAVGEIVASQVEEDQRNEFNSWLSTQLQNPVQEGMPNPTNYQAEILTSYNSFYTTLDEALLEVLPTLAENRLFKNAPNLQGIDLKNITKQDLDNLNLTAEQAGKVFEEILKLGGMVVTDLYGSTKAAIEATARAYDADTGKTVGAAIIDALTEDTLTEAVRNLAE